MWAILSALVVGIFFLLVVPRLIKGKSYKKGMAYVQIVLCNHVFVAEITCSLMSTKYLTSTAKCLATAMVNEGQSKALKVFVMLNQTT